MRTSVAIIIAAGLVIFPSCRQRPAVEQPLSPDTEAPVVAEPPAGAVRLCIVATAVRHQVASSTTNCFLIPFDGSKHNVSSGRQLKYQTRVNNTITTAYVDAGLQINARLSLIPGRNDTVVTELRYQDNRVVQQLGIPFQMTEGALIDTVQLNGTWLLTNGQSRRLYEWTQDDGGRAVSTSLEATVMWQDSLLQIPSGLSSASASSDVGLTSYVSSANRSRRHKLSCDWVDLGKDEAGAIRGLSCTAEFGKQLPFATELGGTKFISYVQMTSGVSMDWNAIAGTHLHYFDRGLEAETDLSKPDLLQSRATDGDFRFPIAMAEARHVQLSVVGNPESVATTIDEFRQRSVLLAKQP